MKINVRVLLQAVEELLECLDLEKSSYHMGLSRVSTRSNPRPTASVGFYSFLIKSYSQNDNYVVQLLFRQKKNTYLVNQPWEGVARLRNMLNKIEASSFCVLWLAFAR